MSSTNELALLLDIIQANGKKILDICSAQNKAYPSLHNPLETKAEEIRHHQDIRGPTNLALAAARQLVATLEEPDTTIRETVFSTSMYFSLKTVVDAHVPEILEEAGPKGLHVNEIGSRAGMLPKKVGRVLRLLATNFFFKEVEPEVFANNRISSLISTGKPSAELLRDATHKFEGTNGVAATIDLQSLWVAQGDAEMPNTILFNEKIKFSEEPADCSFNQLHGGSLLWEWLAMPENAQSRKTFDIAMATNASLHPPDALAKAYDWGSLPDESYLVDVGGGMGGVTIGLLKSFPRLKAIVQDLPDAVRNGEKLFKETLPDAVASGRIKFEVHNFFEPQPPRESPPAIFLLRLITHDHSDPYFLKIIQNLRRSAGPSTRLLIQDFVLLHACPVGIDAQKVEADGEPLPPTPLLRNLAMPIPYLADLMMMNVLNGQERTLLHFQSVLKEGGWKLVEMKRCEEIGLHLPLLVAIPAAD